MEQVLLWPLHGFVLILSIFITVILIRDLLELFHQLLLPSITRDSFRGVRNVMATLAHFHFPTIRAVLLAIAILVIIAMLYYLATKTDFLLPDERMVRALRPIGWMEGLGRWLIEQIEQLFLPQQDLSR